MHDRYSSDIYNLGDIDNVNTTGEADDVIIQFNATTGKWEITTLAGFNALLDHGLLLGLDGDDHAQYLLLAGRSGGQTAIGGADAADNLTLKSTSNGIKGVIAADGETVRMKRLLAGGVI